MTGVTQQVVVITLGEVVNIWGVLDIDRPSSLSLTLFSSKISLGSLGNWVAKKYPLTNRTGGAIPHK